MSQQNQQTISGYASKVTPFRAVAADANFIVATPAGFGPTGPKFIIAIGVYVPAVPAVPATPAIPQRSGPNLPDYVPAVPATPGSPEVPAGFQPQRQEELTLNQAEWDNWDKTTTDEAYVLAIAAARFGWTLQA